MGTAVCHVPGKHLLRSQPCHLAFTREPMTVTMSLSSPPCMVQWLFSSRSSAGYFQLLVGTGPILALLYTLGHTVPFHDDLQSPGPLLPLQAIPPPSGHRALRGLLRKPVAGLLSSLGPPLSWGAEYQAFRREPPTPPFSTIFPSFSLKKQIQEVKGP